MPTIIDKRQKKIRLGDLLPGDQFAHNSSKDEFGVVLDKDGLAYPSNEELNKHGIPTSTKVVPFFNINDSSISWKAASSMVSQVSINYEIYNL